MGALESSALLVDFFWDDMEEETRTAEGGRRGQCSSPRSRRGRSRAAGSGASRGVGPG